MVPKPESSAEVTADLVQSAREAGLRYVMDHQPGIRRRVRGKEFAYVQAGGRPLTDHNELIRVKRLGIPPAWTQVWICPIENGHLQATGRDARGRKQYRYHQRWREVRDETKYERMLAFGAALPKIRKRVAKDLARPGLPREKVLGAVVQLMEKTLIRVGNDEYARQNNSYGLTTMRDKHVAVSGSSLKFEFAGKSGKRHSIPVEDPKLARIVARCRDLPGYELFQYYDEKGVVRDVGSADINAYLREVAGEEFTAKDFRTWFGTVLAALALREFEKVDSDAQAKKNIVQAIEAVARMLGNTPAICRKCYVHPTILECYLDGTMVETLRRRAEERIAQSLRGLRPEEAAVIMLLQRRLAAEKGGLGNEGPREAKSGRAPTPSSRKPARRGAPAPAARRKTRAAPLGKSRPAPRSPRRRPL